MKDRRIQKTKDAIQSALAKLLREKSIDKMTVKLLCEVANINKSTFYLHYRDIYDCAEYLRDTIVDDLIAVFAPYSFADIINNFSIVLEDIMITFDKNKDLYMPFLKSPSLSYNLCSMKNAIIEKVLEKVDDQDRNHGMDQFIVTFIISGMISVLEQHDFTDLNQQTISNLAYKVQNGFASMPRTR